LIMTEWQRSFFFKGKELGYNRIRYNNPTERCVEIPIAFEFLANLDKKDRILEVGNVLAYYENTLSEHMGILRRKIVDKFENELGVDNEDLMNLRSAEKFDAVVCISTVEHIGQEEEPSGTYGEHIENRDLETPLKAIAKIYDLLDVDGKALITVPFGTLTDGNWYIQFSGQYLAQLKKYGVPKEAIATNFLKQLDRNPIWDKAQMLWAEVDGLEVSDAEYNYPFPYSNAIAVIELTKLSNDFHLNLDVEPAPLFYHKEHDIRRQMEQYQDKLYQTQAELEQSQTQLDQTQRELEQSQSQLIQTSEQLEQSQSQQIHTHQELEEYRAKLHQTQGELEQSQSALHQTQEELEQSQSALHQTQEELEQSQSQQIHTHQELEEYKANLHQTQEELEQSQSALHQTQGELEQSQSALHQTQGELEQSQYQLHQTQGALEQSQSVLHQTQGELEQSQSVLHQTQRELEQSQSVLHQTQVELGQSQSVLHQTQRELEQSQSVLHQTQVELGQSQSQLHQYQTQLYQNQQELEGYHAQLHQIQEELKRSRFQQTLVGQTTEPSQTQYRLLIGEAWYAYHCGDLTKMRECLEESLKCTFLSRTETVNNWLESFGKFSSEQGSQLDTYSLTNLQEWKQLMRQVMAIKPMFLVNGKG
jgi:multidrug resistance efflux pump